MPSAIKILLFFAAHGNQCALQYVAITGFGRRVRWRMVRASPSESARPVYDAVQPMTYASPQDSHTKETRPDDKSSPSGPDTKPHDPSAHVAQSCRNGGRRGGGPILVPVNRDK